MTSSPYPSVRPTVCGDFIYGSVITWPGLLKFQYLFIMDFPACDILTVVYFDPDALDDLKWLFAPMSFQLHLTMFAVGFMGKVWHFTMCCTVHYNFRCTAYVLIAFWLLTHIPTHLTCVCPTACLWVLHMLLASFTDHPCCFDVSLFTAFCKSVYMEEESVIVYLCVIQW